MNLLFSAKGFLLPCAIVLLCLSVKVSVGLQGVTLSLSMVEPVLAKSGVAVSDEGTTIQLGNRVIYLDDLTRDDVNWIWQSFLYGGVMSAIFSTMALSYGFYFHHHWLNSCSIAILGTATSALLYTDAILTRFRFGYALVRNVFSLDYPMPYAAVACLVLTREEHNQNNPLRTYVSPKLLLLLPLVKILSLLFFEDKGNTKTHMDLTMAGRAAGLFIIYTGPSPMKRISYKLERAGVSELSADHDGYSALAKAMDENGLSAVYIAPSFFKFFPMPSSKPDGNQVPEYLVALAFICFHVHDGDELVYGMLVQRASDLKKSEVFPPYLLSAFSNSYNRSAIVKARTLLAPVFLEEVAQFLNEYGNNKTVQTKDIAGNVLHYYFYNRESRGEVADIQHTKDTSYFTFPGSDGFSEATITWSSQIDGQQTLALDSGCNEDNSCVFSQYKVPAWVNKVLSIQLAYLGYFVGFNWAQSAVNAVRSGKHVLPNFEATDYNGDEDRCPVCMRPSISNEEGTFDGLNEDEPVALLNLACKHPICADCQNQLIQNQLDDNLLSAWKLQRFGVKCPTCNQKSSFTLLP
ncbi:MULTISPECIES: hypothetical protein [unclassified Endozoicomonas]|uniref:hypothetical protein n=2 Tax=Endozoicomonas TaxID=305899 RepID=UPI00214986B7|nr:MULTISPECIES: hypothetical protein [unclassified Endozoicomonas]